MISEVKSFFRKWLLAFVYPKPLIGLLYFPRYLLTYFEFMRKEPIKFLDAYPCLCDWTKSTPFDPHYFYQSAWLARSLASRKPAKHVDISSDVRMIGVLSAFIPVEFMDYRPLDVELSGLKCSRGNILDLSFPDESIASMSCLHVVEHIGLGRYGDPIDPDGSISALLELQRVMAPDSILYLSVPVGRERVCFNAHRVFSPDTIFSRLPKMDLLSFSVIDDAGCFWPEYSIDKAKKLDYGCGLFVMKKRSNDWLSLD